MSATLNSYFYFSSVIKTASDKILIGYDMKSNYYKLAPVARVLYILHNIYIYIILLYYYVIINILHIYMFIYIYIFVYTLYIYIYISNIYTYI